MLEVVADAVPILLSYIDEDENHRFNNAAYSEWFGSPLERLTGRPFREVLGESAYAILRGRIREALSGTLVRFEGELDLPVVGRRHVSMTLAPDRDRAGNVRGFYSLIQDRTTADSTERALRDAIVHDVLSEQSDRRVLARRLDDELGQMLSLVSMKLEALQDAPARQQSALLQEIGGLVESTRDRVAHLSYHLSPSVLFDVGVVAAAEWLAEELEQRDGVRVDVDSSGEIEALDEAGRIILFRALQDFLSRPTLGDRGTTHVRIARRGDRAHLEVSGSKVLRGFEDDDTRLTATRTLAELLGGQLSVDRDGDKGAWIRIELPIRGDLRSGAAPGTMSP